MTMPLLRFHQLLSSKNIQPFRQYAWKQAAGAAKRLNALPAARRKRLCLLLALMWSASCLAPLFYGGPGAKKTLAISPLPVPAGLSAAPERRETQIYLRLQQFVKYLDSLRQHAPGQFDKIRRSRPGLLDSLDDLLENNLFTP